MVKRILSAIPALILLASVIFIHGIYAKLIVAAVGVLCMHEMLCAASNAAKPLKIVGYGFAALSFPAYQYAHGFAGVAVLYLVAVMCVFVALVFFERDMNDGFMTIFSISYPGMFYVFLIAIPGVVIDTAPPRIHESQILASQFLMIMAFGAAIITDTFAYFTGMLFGRHKLAERISPKKTIEGAIGGTVFCAAAVYLFGSLAQRRFGINVPVYWYALLGILLPALAQLGDLTASKIKRKFGVKDYGNIMAGHGGALDRLDSILFVAPAVLAFYRFVVTYGEIFR